MVYVGSKARLAKYIAPIIQSYIGGNTLGYLEPFVGGANMIQHIECARRYGSDSNKYLIAILQWCQNPDNVLPYSIDEDTYNRVKENKQDYPDYYVGLVGFCSTYGGKFFGGYARDRQTDRNIPNERLRNLDAQRKYVQDVKFGCMDYCSIRSLKNWVIYCDPPYQNSTGYGNGFAHEKFWAWVRIYSMNNIVLVSEYAAPSDFKSVFSKTLSISLTNSATNSIGYAKGDENVFIWEGL